MIGPQNLGQFEGRVLDAARSFTYPPTPDLADMSVRRRGSVRRPTPRWAYAIAVVVVTLTALLAVPKVRAVLLEFLQIGAVQIEVSPESQTEEKPEARNEFDPLENLISASDLMGETTLIGARDMVDFPIPLPTYPSDLSEPDHVYVQSVERGKNFIILTWMDNEDATKVEIAIYIIGPGISLTKGPVEEIQARSVNGHPAAYLRGAHYLQVDGTLDYGVLVHAAALVWEADGITYRIEADLPVGELVQIAESLSAE